jgi:hypothetical protein
LARHRANQTPEKIQERKAADLRNKAIARADDPLNKLMKGK